MTEMTLRIWKPQGKCCELVIERGGSASVYLSLVEAVGLYESLPHMICQMVERDTEMFRERLEKAQADVSDYAAKLAGLEATLLKLPE